MHHTEISTDTNYELYLKQYRLEDKDGVLGCKTGIGCWAIKRGEDDPENTVRRETDRDLWYLSVYYWSTTFTSYSQRIGIPDRPHCQLFIKCN